MTPETQLLLYNMYVQPFPKYVWVQKSCTIASEASRLLAAAISKITRLQPLNRRL